jgi:hypothetical protein
VLAAGSACFRGGPSAYADNIQRLRGAPAVARTSAGGS